VGHPPFTEPTIERMILLTVTVVVGGSVRFDLLISFASGFGAALVLMSSLQKRVDRLRWRTLRIAIDAGISIEQYARDLGAAEGGTSR
jgi:hypothetical protein